MYCGGYDFEVVGPYAKDYECPVCLLLIRDAVELPCSLCVNLVSKSGIMNALKGKYLTAFIYGIISNKRPGGIY